MRSEHMKKAMSQSMWILVAIVVSIIIGVVVISLFSKSAHNTSNTAGGQIDNTGQGMARQSCEALCASCKIQNGANGCGSTSAAWNNMRGIYCAADYCT